MGHGPIVGLLQSPKIGSPHIQTRPGTFLGLAEAGVAAALLGQEFAGARDFDKLHKQVSIHQDLGVDAQGKQFSVNPAGFGGGSLAQVFGQSDQVGEKNKRVEKKH